MKKFTLLITIAIVSINLLFASPALLNSTEDIKTFGRTGNPIETDTLYDGYVLSTGANPATLDFGTATIEVRPSSILSVVNTSDDNLEFYLLDGEIYADNNASESFTVYTPWGKYIAPTASSFSISSKDKEETVSSYNGEIIHTNAISNATVVIRDGETKNLLTKEGYETSPIVASTRIGVSNAAPTEDTTEKETTAEVPSYIREGSVNEVAIVENEKVNEYRKHVMDGGVKLQAYSRGDTLGRGTASPGDLGIEALSLSINPFITFGKYSHLEFRLSADVDPVTMQFKFPWEGLSFDSVENGFRAVSTFINDFNIANILHITRTRDLNLAVNNLNLKTHKSDGAKLPLYLDLDLTYFKLNAFAEDLYNINTPNYLRSANISIIPAGNHYPFSINVGAIYNRISDGKVDDAEMLFNASLDFPIINNHLSLNAHFGLPWAWKQEDFGSIWDLRKHSFYAGADLSLDYGFVKMLVGADYSSNRLFTGYMNLKDMSNWMLANLHTADTEGLSAITPYLYLDFDFKYAGFAISATYPFFLGSVRPQADRDPFNYFNKYWQYLFNANASVFVKPFGNDSLKLSAEYSFAKIYKDAMSGPFDFDYVRLNWVPSIVLSASNGPLYFKGTLDFDYDDTYVLRPILSMLMSVNLGSDYVFNPSYYRARKVEHAEKYGTWRPVLQLELAEDVLFGFEKNRDTNATDIYLASNFRIKPIIGVEHPYFALTLKYEFKDLAFKDFNDIQTWSAGRYIDSFLNQLRIYTILNVASNSSYNIEKLSVLSTTPIRTGLALDFNLFNIFGINSQNFATNLDNAISHKYLDPFDAFLGYKSKNLSVYLGLLTEMDWRDGFAMYSKPSFNFEFNIIGINVGAFFATTMNVVKPAGGNTEFTFGMGNGAFNTWDMLAGATIGYENSFIKANLTGGVQQNDGIFRYNDALSVGLDSNNNPTSYRIVDANGDEVRNTLIPFFNLELGGKVADWFSLSLDYTINVAPSFGELYRDRLSAKLSITSAVIDFNAILEKRGAFLGGNIAEMWTNPTDRDTALAYKLGLDFKTTTAKFGIEYQNEFFGITTRGSRTDVPAGRLTVKTAIGLL